VLCPWASKGFFPGGGSRGFFQNISRGAKSGEIYFFPLKTRKTTFFCWKCQNPVGVKAPTAPLPTPMVMSWFESQKCMNQPLPVTLLLNHCQFFSLTIFFYFFYFKFKTHMDLIYLYVHIAISRRLAKLHKAYRNTLRFSDVNAPHIFAHTIIMGENQVKKACKRLRHV